VETKTSTAVLVIRVWFDGDPPQLRARLIEVRGTSGPEQVLSAAGTADDLYAVVRQWVEALTSD
jgi:hypothetical protein